MRVYIAGTFNDERISSGDIVTTLESLGHVVTSQWHRPGKWLGEAKRASENERYLIASQNFKDIDEAEVIVAVPLAGHPLRGCHVEVGYAIGTKKPVFVLGDVGSLNAMATHALVSHITDLSSIPIHSDETYHE